MKQLTEKQIVENWEKLLQLIRDTFDEPRCQKLLDMYDYFDDRMPIAPASIACDRLFYSN